MNVGVMVVVTSLHFQHRQEYRPLHLAVLALVR